QQPGLLLMVKRRLVKLAYNEGRLLDEADLSDDAVFDLVRTNATVRNIATREIEQREYLRVRPLPEQPNNPFAQPGAPVPALEPGAGRPLRDVVADMQQKEREDRQRALWDLRSREAARPPSSSRDRDRDGSNRDDSRSNNSNRS